MLQLLPMDKQEQEKHIPWKDLIILKQMMREALFLEQPMKYLTIFKIVKKLK